MGVFPNPSRIWIICHGTVVIPWRTDAQLVSVGILFFVHVSTATITVIIHAEFIYNQEVDKRSYINPFTVPQGIVCIVRSVQGIFKGINEGFNVISLHR